MASTLQAVALDESESVLVLRLHRVGRTESLLLDTSTFAAMANAMAEPADSFWVRGLRGEDRWWQPRACFAVFFQARRGRSRNDQWIPCSRAVFRGINRMLEAEWRAA